MKRLFAILFILLTAGYVLPVNNGLKAENDVSCKSADGKSDDTGSETKKETQKEFIAAQPVLLTAVTCNTANAIYVQANITVLHNVETPPPDSL